MPKAIDKPKPLRMKRNMKFPGDPLAPNAAICTAWQIKLCDEDHTPECGRSIEVEPLCFDEGDGDKLRKLAAWLVSAAEWIEQ